VQVFVPFHSSRTNETSSVNQCHPRGSQEVG
jgi:hypothetical protein